MTRQEYKQLLFTLSKEIRQKYGLNDDLNLDNEKCIHIDDCEFYPDIPCIIVDEVPITWDKELPYIKPDMPAHIAALKEWIKGRRHKSIGIIHMTVNTDDPKLYCLLYSKTYDTSGLTAVPFDESVIYYDPKEIDLKNDELSMTIAKVIFTAMRYDAEYIVPSKNLNPKHWTSM